MKSLGFLPFRGSFCGSTNETTNETFLRRSSQVVRMVMAVRPLGAASVAFDPTDRNKRNLQATESLSWITWFAAIAGGVVTVVYSRLMGEHPGAARRKALSIGAVCPGAMPCGGAKRLTRAAATSAAMNMAQFGQGARGRCAPFVRRVCEPSFPRHRRQVR
jgi:hypothetical protein